MNQSNDKIDMFFKALSLCILPAIAWLLSLSAERARVEQQINDMDVRLNKVERTLSMNEKSVNELVITAKYIHEDLKELKERMK